MSHYAPSESSKDKSWCLAGLEQVRAGVRITPAGSSPSLSALYRTEQPVPRKLDWSWIFREALQSLKDNLREFWDDCSGFLEGFILELTGTHLGCCLTANQTPPSNDVLHLDVNSWSSGPELGRWLCTACTWLLGVLCDQQAAVLKFTLEWSVQPRQKSLWEAISYSLFLTTPPPVPPLPFQDYVICQQTDLYWKSQDSPLRAVLCSQYLTFPWKLSYMERPIQTGGALGGQFTKLGHRNILWKVRSFNTTFYKRQFTFTLTPFKKQPSVTNKTSFKAHTS